MEIRRESLEESITREKKEARSFLEKYLSFESQVRGPALDAKDAPMLFIGYILSQIYEAT